MTLGTFLQLINRLLGEQIIYSINYVINTSNKLTEFEVVFFEGSEYKKYYVDDYLESWHIISDMRDSLVKRYNL